MAHVRRKLAVNKKQEDTILVFLEREPKNKFADCMPPGEKKAAWEKFKDEVLEEWIGLYPGTRPKVWWCYEAPEDEREQLKGTGKIYPAMDHENNFRHNKGVPDAWWFGKTIDLNNPPVYESQATYLKRHKLFMPGEAKRLTKKDFDPVLIKQEDKRHD